MKELNRDELLKVKGGDSTPTYTGVEFTVSDIK